MSKYNRNFELNIDDLARIEDALRESKSRKALSDDHAAEVREIHDLLGRLHNQKEFYRPRSGYISG